MKIVKISIAKLAIPLVRPFITALRRTEQVEDIVLIIESASGLRAFGSAAATPAITGDSSESIIGGLQLLAPKLLGQDITNFEQLLRMVTSCLANNSSAKGACDIALHDLLSQHLQIPLYQFLGGGRPECQTLTTVSVKTVDEMVADAKLFVSQGFTTLKLKVGLNPSEDIERMQAVRTAVGPKINLIADANQGWDAKAALQVIWQLNHAKLDIAMLEQPVKAWDYASLRYVRDHSAIPIFADEAVFSVRDAVKVISENAVDGINIKLMKSGGIYAARAIYDLATAHNIPCMAGCMLESPVGLTAMASFVASRTNFQFIDLDPMMMIKHNPVQGGAQLNGATLCLSKDPGLGIRSIDGLQIIATYNYN